MRIFMCGVPSNACFGSYSSTTRTITGVTYTSDIRSVSVVVGPSTASYLYALVSFDGKTGNTEVFHFRCEPYANCLSGGQVSRGTWRGNNGPSSVAHPRHITFTDQQWPDIFLHSSSDNTHVSIPCPSLECVPPDVPYNTPFSNPGHFIKDSLVAASHYLTGRVYVLFRSVVNTVALVYCQDLGCTQAGLERYPFYANALSRSNDADVLPLAVATHPVTGIPWFLHFNGSHFNLHHCAVTNCESFAPPDVLYETALDSEASVFVDIQFSTEGSLIATLCHSGSVLLVYRGLACANSDPVSGCSESTDILSYQSDIVPSAGL